MGIGNSNEMFYVKGYSAVNYKIVKFWYIM